MNRISIANIANYEGKVVVIKLVSGIEIVCTVKKYNDRESFIGVFKAREVHAMPNENGQVNISIQKPFMVLNPDAEFDIYPTNILAIYDCPLDIENFYLQITSGIALA